MFKTPSHRIKGDIRYPKISSGTAVIEEIEHDPGRTAPIAKVRLEDGRKQIKRHYGKGSDALRRALEDFFYRETQSRPVVLPRYIHA